MKKKISFLIILLYIVVFTNSASAMDVVLLVTHDNAFFDKWEKVGLDAGPNLVIPKQVFRNQELLIIPIIGNPAINDASYAKVHYELQLIEPDGKIGYERKGLKSIDSVINAPKIFRASSDYTKLSFDNENKTGKYTIKVAVKDLVGNVIVIKEQQIELVEYKYEKYFSDFESYNKWIYTYYNQSPEKAIDGLIFYSKLPSDIRGKAFPLNSAFFSKIFNDNKYLIPYLLKEYQEQSIDTKIAILGILPYIEYDARDFINNLPAKEKQFYQEWLKIHTQYPRDELRPQLLKDTVIQASQLDMLWGTFMASGEYKPLRAIVNVLELGQYKGYFDKYTQTKQEEDQANAACDLVYRAAKWSLNSHKQQHRLVRDYCNYIYNNEPLSEQVKSELGEIVEQGNTRAFLY